MASWALFYATNAIPRWYVPYHHLFTRVGQLKLSARSTTENPKRIFGRLSELKTGSEDAPFFLILRDIEAAYGGAYRVVLVASLIGVWV